MTAVHEMPATEPLAPPASFHERFVGEGITFDDVLLVPAYSAILPSQTDVRTKLTRRIELPIPLLSAAMDTVTESALAIAIAREGGMGVIHKNLSIEDQAGEIDKVKRSESGMITDPITLPPDASVAEVLKRMQRFHISGVPIVEGKRLVGIVTNRDLRFLDDTAQPVARVMTKDHLITVPIGTTLEEARRKLQKHRIEKLLVVNGDFELKGLITIKDLQKLIDFPHACKDDRGRLRVGAAIGVSGDYLERAQELVRMGVDVLVVDSAHAHSANVFEVAHNLRSSYPEVDLIVGNIATAAAARDLLTLEVDAIKVGIGPGSTCTTRVIAGIGVPQLTAIFAVVHEAAQAGVPVIADGGIRYSGDIPKAIAAGAHSVMIGNLFAGTEETPGETVLKDGRTYKVYCGMGSTGAMKRGSADRYDQSHVAESERVAQGIEGRVPHRGPVARMIQQLVGGLRAGMGYCGVPNIETLRTKTQFIRITPAGYREGHPSTIIDKEAPNYWVS